MKSKRNLTNEQFYTDETLAIKLISLIDLKKYSLIIEPSAGKGSFSLQIPNCIAFDIEPRHSSILQADFLELNIKTTNPKDVLIIGNPPFGRQSSLAIKFIKKACFLADTVAFILPRSFKKESMKDKFPSNFWCVLEIDLGEKIFLTEKDEDYGVKCVFQVWGRKSETRKKSKITTDLFEWCERDQAEMCLIRVGSRAGYASLDVDTTKSVKTHYFLKHKTAPLNEIYEILKSISWEHSNTTGPRSISKREFIEKFIKIWTDRTTKQSY